MVTEWVFIAVISALNASSYLMNDANAPGARGLSDVYLSGGRSFAGRHGRSSAHGECPPNGPVLPSFVDRPLASTCSGNWVTKWRRSFWVLFRDKPFTQDLHYFRLKRESLVQSPWSPIRVTVRFGRMMVYGTSWPANPPQRRRYSQIKSPDPNRNCRVHGLGLFQIHVLWSFSGKREYAATSLRHICKHHTKL
jgi:hypothetical protein